MAKQSQDEKAKKDEGKDCNASNGNVFREHNMGKGTSKENEGLEEKDA